MLTNQCTRIAKLRFYNGYAPAKKWVIVATITSPQSRDFKRYAELNMKRPIYIYVDVDETFVRNYGTKRIPIPSVIEHIKELKSEGALMYCWSSGGAEYANSSAQEFGIDYCFIDFLPKPDVVIDDLSFKDWRGLVQLHPNECPDNTIQSYKDKIKNR